MLMGKSTSPLTHHPILLYHSLTTPHSRKPYSDTILTRFLLTSTDASLPHPSPDSPSAAPPVDTLSPQWSRIESILGLL